jgi:hypothetical protein
MDYSYYGRLDKTKPSFTIGYQVMNDKIKKLFEDELEKFKEELCVFMDEKQKEYLKELKMVKHFVSGLVRSCAEVNKKPVKKKNKLKDVIDEVEDDEDF